MQICLGFGIMKDSKRKIGEFPISCKSPILTLGSQASDQTGASRDGGAGPFTHETLQAVRDPISLFAKREVNL